MRSRVSTGLCLSISIFTFRIPKSERHQIRSVESFGFISDFVFSVESFWFSVPGFGCGGSGGARAIPANYSGKRARAEQKEHDNVHRVVPAILNPRQV